VAGFSGSWGSACGHPVEPGTRFCPVCGQPTGAVEITSESSDGIDLNTGTYGKVQAPLLPPLPGTGGQPAGTSQPAAAPSGYPQQESAQYPSDPRQTPGSQPAANPFQQPDGPAPTTVQRTVSAPGSPAAPAPTAVQRTLPAPAPYGSQPAAAAAGLTPGYGQPSYGQPGYGQTPPPPPYGQPGSDPKLPYTGQQPGPGNPPQYGVPLQPYAAPPSWPQTPQVPQTPQALGYQPPAGPGWGPPGNGSLPAAPGAPAYAPGNQWAGPAGGGWPGPQGPGQQGPSQPAGRGGGIIAAIVSRLRDRRNGNQRLSAGV
jgi:hypothetical protein